MSEFSLRRLMGTCLSPKEGENVVVLTDLKDPERGVTVNDILSGDTQRIAYEVFFQGLQAATDLRLGAVSFYVFREVQGSNLDLPSVVFDLDGRGCALVDALRDADIVLALTNHSATGPLKILARQLGFRAATSAGTNEAVLSSGLAADYREVSAVTKRLRDFLRGTKTVEVGYTIARQAFHFTIEVSDQDLGIDDGIYTQVGEIGNLPTGEVFYVPERVDGVIPIHFDDHWVGLCRVEAGQITDLAPDVETSDLAAPFIKKIQGEPRMGEIVELGFGTQPFPRTGVETQDEKVLGTFHIALGRNDFLGGKNGPEEFLKRENALHKDILYHPYLQPEISNVVVQIVRSDGREMAIIEDFKPTKALEEAIRPSEVGSLLPSY